MDLREIIIENYNLDPILKIEKTKNGNNAFLVEIKNEKFIAKTNERLDFVNIYDKVQKKLTEMNMLQRSIIKTKKDSIITPEGIVLYEYIYGDCYASLTQKQTDNVIKYIKKYNEALQSVPFKNEELTAYNHWDKAKSIDFIIDEFPNFLSELELDNQDKLNIYEVINILSKNKSLLSKQNKQLIHSDLGADNFIFNNDEIVSIIDFTPEFNNEIYSLCQFIYWNYLWHVSDIDIDKDEINNYLKLYNKDNKMDTEQNIYYVLLLNSALYRIVGPILDMFHKGAKDYNILKRRFLILDELLKIFNVLFS